MSQADEDFWMNEGREDNVFEDDFAIEDDDDGPDSEREHSTDAQCWCGGECEYWHSFRTER